MVPLLGFTALGIDIGYIVLTKTDFQVAADAAALAAAGEMLYNKPTSEQSKSIAAAKAYAGYHRSGGPRSRWPTATCNSAIGPPPPGPSQWVSHQSMRSGSRCTAKDSPSSSLRS